MLILRFVIFIFTRSFLLFFLFFFFNDTATTEIYTLSLHDALPICTRRRRAPFQAGCTWTHPVCRSEEHTSELQSRENLVCRLLLEKKKKKIYHIFKKLKKKRKSTKLRRSHSM